MRASRPFAFAFALLALAAQPSSIIEADGGCVGIDVSLKPMGFETITVSSTAIGFTAATISTAPGNQALVAVVSIESGPIRFRDDGTVPTAAIGHPAAAGSTVLVCGRESVTQIRFIRSSGTDATVSATYYRRR